MSFDIIDMTVWHIKVNINFLENNDTLSWVDYKKYNEMINYIKEHCKIEFKNKNNILEKIILEVTCYGKN